MVTNGGLLMHHQRAPELSRQWGPPQSLGYTSYNPRAGTSSLKEKKVLHIFKPGMLEHLSQPKNPNRRIRPLTRIFVLTLNGYGFIGTSNVSGHIYRINVLLSSKLGGILYVSSVDKSIANSRRQLNRKNVS